MRRRRLKHCADTLCHIFCGWRLQNSYSHIESLGSGMLEINALTAEARFNGEPTDPLSIAGELQSWLVEDCDRNSIPIQKIRIAKLNVTLKLSKVDWKCRQSRDHWFDHKGAEIVWRPVNRCVIQCGSLVQTDECEYRSAYQDVEEWPEGFSGPR